MLWSTAIADLTGPQIFRLAFASVLTAQALVAFVGQWPLPLRLEFLTTRWVELFSFFTAQPSPSPSSPTTSTSVQEVTDERAPLLRSNAAGSAATLIKLRDYPSVSRQRSATTGSSRKPAFISAEDGACKL